MPVPGDGSGTPEGSGGQGEETVVVQDTGSGFTGGPEDVVEVNISADAEPSGEEGGGEGEGGEGEGGGSAEAAAGGEGEPSEGDTGVIDLGDGTEIPVKRVDGKWVPDADALAEYQERTGMSRERHEEEISRARREAREEARREAAESKPEEKGPTFEEQIQAVEAEENPHDPEDAAKEYHAFERDRDRKVRALMRAEDKAGREAIQEKIAKQEQREAEEAWQASFDRQMEREVFPKIGVPKGDAENAQIHRRLVSILTAWDPQTRGVNDKLAQHLGIETKPVDVVARKYHNMLLKLTHIGQATQVKEAKGPKKETTPAVHKGGSPAVAPKPPAPKDDYKIDLSRQGSQITRRILSGAVRRTAAQRASQG